jgi:hypothetical protein
MTALAAESYMRAYSAAIRLQQLVELEEIITVRCLEKQVPVVVLQAARDSIAKRWNKRFESMGRQPDFMRRVLGVRALLFTPLEQANSWLLYTSVCARSGRRQSNRRAIAILLGIPDWDAQGRIDINAILAEDGVDKSRSLVGAFKYWWRNGRRQGCFACFV